MAIRSGIMARVLAIGAALATAGYSSCSFSSGGERDDPGDIFDPDTEFRTTLTLRDTNGTTTTSFVMGEPIRFDLDVENRTRDPVTLQFADGQIYDFYVLDVGGNQVRWRWAAGKAFTQMPVDLAFGPQSSRSWSIEWNGVLADGTQLPVGEYRARGVIVSQGFAGDPLENSDLASDLLRFTVR